MSPSAGFNIFFRAVDDITGGKKPFSLLLTSKSADLLMVSEIFLLTKTCPDDEMEKKQNPKYKDKNLNELVKPLVNIKFRNF
jgi:hypothetical protein